MKKMSINSVSFKKEGGVTELKVEDNKEFNIVLEGNPTTGYSWSMQNVEALKISNIIQPLNLNEYNNSDDYIQDAHEPGLCGVGGKWVFKFKVNNAAGKELPKLLFEYKRPWEKDVPPLGKAEITLKL